MLYSYIIFSNQETFNQESSTMGNLRKKRRRKIAQHKRKKLLKAMRHKNK